MKILTALNEGQDKLKKNDIKSSMLDSEILISEALKKDRKFVILNPAKEIEESEYLNFKNLINKRSKGKPMAQIIGKKSFWKYEFLINENVLIPRPDTEVVVEQVLKIYKNKEYVNFLDIGVGSGCILLTILNEKKNFYGTGIDLSSESIKICALNDCKLGIKNRYKLFKSDIDNFSYGKYDLIISNHY